MGLRPDSAQVLHHAAQLRQLARAGLVFVIFVLRAGMVDEVIGIEAGPTQRVEVCGLQPIVCQQQKRFGDPVGMGRSAGDIYHRTAGLRMKAAVQRAARQLSVIGQPDRARRVAPGRGYPAIGRAGTDSQHVARERGKLAHPVQHRAARCRPACGSGRSLSAP